MTATATRSLNGTVLPMARISQRDPAAEPATPPEPCSANVAVRLLEDHLKVDSEEFQQMHRIGIQWLTTRNAHTMSKVGPGAYDVEKACAATAPQSPRWSLRTSSARLNIVEKDAEQLAADRQATLKRNLRSLKTLFLPGLFELKSDFSEGGATNSPRWLRPTRSASSRQKVIQVERSATQALQHAAAAPMTFSTFHASSSSGRDGSSSPRHGTKEEAADDSKPTPPEVNGNKQAFAAVPRPPPKRPSPPVERNYADASPEVKAASLRKTLARPSSANVKYGDSGHWVDGCLRQCAVQGVCVVRPRDGKTDAMYDVVRAAEVTRQAPPSVSLGTSPRFAGDAPIRTRPASAPRGHLTGTAAAATAAVFPSGA